VIDSDGDSAPVVVDRHGIILVNRYLDMIAGSGQSLVNRIIDNLIDQMVKTPKRSGPDVHTGSLSDSLKALKYLDLIFIIDKLFVFVV
jgi:hypothetical protein